MALNGIDVSSWQTGINIAAVPADFVIVKATQGTWYTSPCFRAQADTTLNSGKLLGVYHYITGGNAQAEAQYFVNAAKPYIGRAVLALDFESDSNKAYDNIAYLQQCAQTVYNLTGVRPLLYGSQRDYGRLAAVSKATNCGLWIAQYRDYAHIGYQDKPWNEGAYDCAIRQYSSAGALPNYSGNLDLNKFYGDAAAWQKYAQTDQDAVPQTVEPEQPDCSPITIDDDVSSFTMHIPWGTSQDQRMSFIRCGNVVTVNGCGSVVCGGGSWIQAREQVPDGFRPISLATIHLSGDGTGSVMVKPDGSVYWDGDGKNCFTHVSGVWITKDNQPK